MGIGGNDMRGGGDHSRGLNFRRIALSEELTVARPSAEEAAEMRDLLLRERETEKEIQITIVTGFKTRGIWRSQNSNNSSSYSRFECMCTQTMEISEKLKEIPSEHVTDLLRLPKQTALLSKAFPQWNFARSRTLWRYSQPTDAEILNHPKLAGAIREGVLNYLNDPAADPNAFNKVYQRASARVATLFRRLRAKISRHLIHFTGWLFLHLLPFCFTRLVISDRQAALLRELHLRKLPIVFLPLHRSHLDYVLLPFVLWRLDLPMTFTAAGDNLNIFGLGALLRGFGAFFIRRKQAALEEDPIYKSLLQTYVEYLMSRGENLEIYVEAGRSRTGRCRPPKAGLLAMVDTACVHGPVQDAILLPMAYGYDRPPDVGFGEQRMGSPKPPETVWTVARSIFDFIRARHGAVRVGFGHPVLLSQFRESLIARHHASSSEALPKAAMAQELAAHGVHFARRALPLTASHLCAFLLLTQYRDGATAAALTRSFDQLACRLRQDCHLAFSAASRPEDAVQSTVELLAPWLEVRRSHGGVAWVAPLLGNPGRALELSYFANHVTEALSIDCVKAAAAVAVAGIGPGGLAAARRLYVRCPLRLDRGAWQRATGMLMRLLSFDLAFRPPCVSQEAAIERDSSLWRAFLFDPTAADPMRCRGAQENDDVLRLDLTANHVPEALTFLATALGPILEAHAALCRVLYDQQEVSHEAAVTRRAMRLLGDRHRNGELFFVESQCLETVNNCLKGLEALEVIDRQHCGSGTVAVTVMDTAKLLDVMRLLETALLRP